MIAPGNGLRGTCHVITTFSRPREKLAIRVSHAFGRAVTAVKSMLTISNTTIITGSLTGSETPLVGATRQKHCSRQMLCPAGLVADGCRGGFHRLFSKARAAGLIGRRAGSAPGVRS